MSDRSIKVKLDEIFDEWELWACLLLRLFLQIFLSFGGTFRRLVSHKWIVILLWLAYLLAEIIALFGLGIIASRQSFIFKSSKYTYDTFEFKVSFSSSKYRLHIFWAPFLLVHLGGPDTITAFAPEDNELWPRHLFYLASQCTAVAYAFNLVEVELNYLYDVLFTKIPVLHHRLGYCCRTLSFAAVVASFTLFHLEHNAYKWWKDSFKLDPAVTLGRPIHNDKYDVVIFYILLIGAVVLEVIAFYMLLFCDWTIIKLRPFLDTKLPELKKKKFCNFFRRKSKEEKEALPVKQFLASTEKLSM